MSSSKKSHLDQIAQEFALLDGIMISASIDSVLQKQQEAKSLLKLVRDPARSHEKQLPHNDGGWWDKLSYDEQLSYLKAHKRSKFKITKHHTSEEPASVTGPDVKGKNRVHQNSLDSAKSNIESTRFMHDESGTLFATIPVGKETVALDVDDWKHAIKHRLRLEKDSRSQKIVLKGELYKWRDLGDNKTDENEKMRLLAGSLFAGGLKNPRIDYKDGNPYNLRRDNILIRTYESGIENQAKEMGAKNVEFKRQKFSRDGVEIEAPSFVAHSQIDGSRVRLGDGFADARTAMVAQDLFEILKNKNGAKGTDTAALNFKQSPTQDDLSKLHLDDVRLLNSIARDGTPDRAIDRLNSLQTASYEDRDLGEDELRTLADRMQLLSDDAGWAHIIDILSPALPDDISRSDLDDNDISLLDLKGLDPLSRDGVFEMVRESKTVVTPMDQMLAQVDEPTKPGEPTHKVERLDGESDDSYLDRITDNLYKMELNSESMPLKDRYTWFMKNREVFERYDTYMGMMRRLKSLGEQLFKDDKGGTRVSQKKAIHIPLLVYPPHMDFQDSKKHIYIFKKHKFRDFGEQSATSHHTYKIPGIYGSPTIDHTPGGYAPATGRNFGPQAGFEFAKAKDGFSEKKHYDMLRKIGYSDLMDNIWDEYDRRKRLGIDTMETTESSIRQASVDESSTIDLTIEL